MAKANIRLKDIAERTGFSVNTVSLALRESPRIPQPTREIIKAAAHALNYLPNQIAQSLVSRQTRTIGLVLTSIRNPILTHTAQAVEFALAARGYSTFFAESNNTLEDEQRVVGMLRSRQVDGMLVYPTNRRRIEHVAALRRAGYPVVLLVADPDAGVDAVGVDDRAGAYRATRHLLDLGHRRIGLLDASPTRGNREKFDGYARALTEAGIDFAPHLCVIPDDHGAASGHAAMARLMAGPERPSAVFCVTDSLALGVLRWCHRNGVRVPADVSIMGYDNIEVAAYATVAISTIDYAVDAVSRGAVARLLTLIAARDGGLPDPKIDLIAPDLIMRESTGPAPRQRP